MAFKSKKRKSLSTFGDMLPNSDTGAFSMFDARSPTIASDPATPLTSQLSALSQETELIRESYADAIQQLSKIYKRHKTLEERLQAKVKKMADGEAPAQAEKEAKMRKLVDLFGDGNTSNVASRLEAKPLLRPESALLRPESGRISPSHHQDNKEINAIPPESIFGQLDNLWETGSNVSNLVFLPNGKLRLLHDCLFICTLSYEIIMVGLCFALDQWTDSIRTDEVIGSSAATILYCITIFLNFRTARLDGWELIGDSEDQIPDLYRMYLNGWFKFDVFITIPFDLIFSAWSAYAFKLLRCIRVARIVRSADLFQQSSPISIQPIYIRLMMFLFFYMSGVHLLTCVWVRSDGAKSDPNTSATDIYISGMYYVVTTMTTVGYGDIIPTTVEHMLLSTVIMIVGAGSYGYVMGNFSRLLVRSDKLKKETDEKRHKIGAFMRFYGIPWSLQKQTFSIFPSMIEREVYDLNQVIGNLPPSLAMKLEVFIKIKLLKQTSFLCELPDRILLLLSDKLLTETVDAGTMIIKQGTSGREMYIISKGAVEVFQTVETTDPETNVTSRKHVWLTNLREGQFFGEFALLGKRKRTTSIRSITACSLFILPLEAFDAVDVIFPELRTRLVQKVNSRNAAVAEELKQERDKMAGIVANWNRKTPNEAAEQKAARKWQKHLKDKVAFRTKMRQSKAKLNLGSLSQESMSRDSFQPSSQTSQQNQQPASKDVV